MRHFILSLNLFCIAIAVHGQGFESRSMNFDGNLRTYEIYIPSSYDGSESLPLVFNFHGGNGSSTDAINISQMHLLSDTANFLVVYPQALQDPNDGNSTNWLHKDPTNHDDVMFIDALISDLSNNYNIDLSRVYACGYSLGGEFTFELGCRLNNKIAAFGVVARTMQQFQYDNCTPVHPTGVITVLGTADITSNYNGVSFAGIQYYVSADQTHQFWADFNNTEVSPIITPIQDASPNDGSTVDRRSWLNGDSCVEVRELRVNNGGHDWPGSFGNQDIDASAEIWKFVSQYDLNGKMSCGGTVNVIDHQRINHQSLDLLGVFNLLGQEVDRTFKGIKVLVYENGDVKLLAD